MSVNCWVPPRGPDEDAPSFDAEAWSKRFDAISEAQSKYLWTLLAVGVFYWVAQADTTQAIPVLGISLPGNAILATAAAVLFFIQLVVFGTMRAVHRADQVLKAVGGVDESLDYHSNAIDWAVYTTDSSPKWVKNLAGLGYAFFMVVFTAEATYFLARLADNPSAAPAGLILFAIGALEAAIVYPFLLMHIVGRLRRFWTAQESGEDIEARLLRDLGDYRSTEREIGPQ